MNTPTRLLLFGLSLFLLAAHLNAAEFPVRELFPKVKTIELDELHQQFEQVVVIDVRSSYEYETLHIEKALHINMDEPDFIDNLRSLRNQDPRPLAFYCNGHTCRKAYEASQRASDFGINETMAFDAGVFDWARAYPEQAVLLGQPLGNAGRLIASEKLEQHMLSPEEFAAKVGDDSIVLDIRDSFQREGINLFPMQQRSVPMDNARLAAFVDQAKAEGKTLLIYDAVGRQVNWLQYYLEAEGLEDYYFMRGGARAFLEF